MSGLEWILAVALFTIYIVCLFTVCSLTFARGYVVLGTVGNFLPIFWLIGAILPAKRGARHEIAQQMRYRATVDPMTR